MTLNDQGLLPKHDHRRPDGTPDEITMYGGWAAPGGTSFMQRFPADPETAELLPDAATNVWVFQIDNKTTQFTYDLERHGQPRYRAVFDLNSPE